MAGFVPLSLSTVLQSKGECTGRGGREGESGERWDGGVRGWRNERSEKYPNSLFFI